MIRSNPEGARRVGPLTPAEFDARLVTALTTPGLRGKALMTALLDTPVAGEITPEQALLAAIEGVDDDIDTPCCDVEHGPEVMTCPTFRSAGPLYDTSLDPISPFFDPASWGDQSRANAERVQGAVANAEEIAAAKARLARRLADAKAAYRKA